MIVGSRIGAAFIVFAIGWTYVIRGRDHIQSLGIGLLSLIVTATTYLPALTPGIVLLNTGSLKWATIPSGSLPNEIISQLFEPIAKASVELLTYTGTFFAGPVLILLSFHLFDRALPDLEDAEEERERLGRYLYRPWVMLIAGAAITLISLSVTLSLSILVPLTRHRLVRVMDNPEAASIVLAGFAAIILVSVVILVTLYRRYENLVLNLTEWATENRRNLAISMGVFILTPLVLLLT
jgi:hypothetical protein